MKEEKKKLFLVLEGCIEKANEEDIKDSQALREIYQLYARLKADEINPAIMNNLLQRRQQQMQEALEKQKNRPVGQNAQEKSAQGEKPRLGF
jgi:DNA-binding transcriptional regulator YbjK